MNLFHLEYSYLDILLFSHFIYLKIEWYEAFHPLPQSALASNASGS
jgi:hypothetical protein